MSTTNKILPSDDLVRIAAFQRKKGVKIALATGVFDLIHAGHVNLLESAARHGEVLFVGINDDQSVKRLKGPTRPINAEHDRMRVIAGLQCVDAVFLIRSDKVTDAIRMVQPDAWCKGGDYSIETLDKDEVNAANEVGAEIVIIPITKGYSTTDMLKRC